MMPDWVHKADEDVLQCFQEPAFLGGGTWQQHSWSLGFFNSLPLVSPHLCGPFHICTYVCTCHVCTSVHRFVVHGDHVPCSDDPCTRFTVPFLKSHFPPSHVGGGCHVTLTVIIFKFKHTRHVPSTPVLSGIHSGIHSSLSLVPCTGSVSEGAQVETLGSTSTQH